MTGWVYILALLVTIASVVYGAGPYLAALLGFTAGTGSTIICALIMLAVALALNMLGTRVLAFAAVIGFTGELLGALAVGGWLLLTERNQDLSMLFDTQGVTGEGGGYLAAFFAAAIIGVYQYYGFEACGDVAEEVPDPTREIPKAMRLTIYIGGAASIFVCLSLLLAVKDFGAIINGEDADPVMTILNDVFGTDGHQARPRRRDDLVPVLHAEPDGRREPADVLLRPRRHDLRLAPAAALRPGAPRAAVRHDRRRRRARRRRARLGDLDQGADLDRVVRDPRHLPRLPDGRAGRAARAAQGLGAVRAVHARPLGHAGHRRRAGVRRADDDQRGLAADPRRALVRQLGRRPSPPSSASGSAWSTCCVAKPYLRSEATSGDAIPTKEER